MADLEGGSGNMQFPQNTGFGIMQGQPQFVQPGASMMQPTNRMMMGQPLRMGPGTPNMVPQGQMVRGPQGMFPVSMMPPGRMMPPTSAPPSYNQARMESYQMRSQNVPSVRKPNPVGKSSEELQREKYFQQQQAKLKHFNKFGSSSLDPNKLIDSMFTDSQAPKPRTNKKPGLENSMEDGFGDFLGGPQGQGHSVINTPIIDEPKQQSQVAVPKAVPTKPATEKKDLTKMMMESCDLNASKKAKLFQKPSLKDISVVHHDPHVIAANVSTNARKWDNAEELSNLFIQEAEKDVKNMPPKPVQTKKVKSPTSKHPPKPPPWLSDDSLIPALYKQVVEASIVEGKIATDRVYPILILSGLPKEKLGFIWGLCNTDTPGQLIVKELFQILAIIALTQNGFHVESIDILSRCPNPPVPFLAPPGGPPQVQPTPVSFKQTDLQSSHSSMAEIQSVPQSSYQTAPTAGIQLLPQTSYQDNSTPTNWVQPVPQSPSSQTSQVEGVFSQPQSNNIVGSVVMTSPATLPVTQLPPAVLPQGMMGNVVHSERVDDDFADFQVAPIIQPPPTGSFKVLMTDVKESKRAPVKDQGEYLYSVPIPDDKAIAETMSPEDLKSSTVSNFFASDDSSEATSPDDDYFDGYKSAESKPSDSTSQFSTDQSENEDFKNFESYLDEFQKKKELRDKESPLHRPVPKFTQIPKVQLPSKQVNQVSAIITTEAKAKVSSDEFSDFADFQSATVTSQTNTELKATASASDLIGEEDKYAALRGLSDFSAEKENNLLGDPEENVHKHSDDMDDGNWADFETVASQNVPTEEETSHTENYHGIAITENKDQSHILGLFEKTDDKSDHFENFESLDSAQPVEQGSDWAAFSGVSTTSSDTVVQSETVENVGTDEEWADFSSDNNFDDFQSAIGDTNKDLVTVKNKALESSEILNLFKVKDTPKEGIKSLDDDVFLSAKPSISLSQNINKMHGIASESTLTQEQRHKHISEEDDFMKPPPLDSVNDDDFETGDQFGTYTGGYDLEDIMQPTVPEKKPMYGWFGINQNFVVKGSKSEVNQPSGEDNDSGKNVTIEITKESDMDDSDSVSSKDNDIFRGKFGLSKGLCEDTQSVSSLEFIVNKQVQGIKDPDSQSMSSNDIGQFEIGTTGVGVGLPAESKSVDSLELRQEEGQDGEMSGSQDNSDKDSKEETPDRIINDSTNTMMNDGPTAFGMPILGDRYSVILPDVTGSDKHAYEWQRLLDNACRMIQDANNIFNSISTSSVCNEVIKSAEGSQYVQGVVEIYRVVCKVITSMKETGITNDKLAQLTKDIDITWNNLAAFLVGGSVMPDDQSLNYTHGILHPDDTTAQYRSCGICLLNVEMVQKGVNSDDYSCLTYGGRQYHASCANFWINCVDSTLPALNLPELL